MATNKKSVLLYCDLIHTVEKMDDKTAGEFFKHYLRYINDQDPETDNLVIELTFESVKQNLKRDLKKWEQRAENSRSNGSKGGRPPKPKEPAGLNENQIGLKEPVTDTVTVTVTDTVNVKENKDIKKPTAFSFYNSLIELGATKQLSNEWLAIRKVKKATNSETAFKAFKTQVEKTKATVNEILELCVINSWKGYNHEWYKTEPSKAEYKRPKINFN